MCIHNQCFEQKGENIIIFHLKIEIFTAVKYCCILHGCVCIMNCFSLQFGKSLWYMRTPALPTNYKRRKVSTYGPRCEKTGLRGV